MNKVSSKLAAGVRKVKAQQKPAPTAPQQTQPQAADKPVVKAGHAGNGAAMHPTRVWPD